MEGHIFLEFYSFFQFSVISNLMHPRSDGFSSILEARQTYSYSDHLLNGVLVKATSRGGLLEIGSILRSEGIILG